MSLPVIVQELETLQPPVEGNGHTKAKASRTRFRHKRLRVVPVNRSVETRAEASHVAWLSVMAHLPPSQLQWAHALSLARELEHMSREALAALAKEAKGSMAHLEASAVEVVRHLRDEWE
jgi:hypothetical protein